MSGNVSVPGEFRQPVRVALQEAFRTEEATEIKLLAGGLSSALVYRIVVRNRPYVMRIQMKGDRKRQYTCMCMAAEAGVAPRVYYADDATGISIVEFIEPKSLTLYTGTRADLLRELAKVIRAIHHLPRFPNFVNFLDAVDELIARFVELDVIPAGALKEHFEAYSEISHAYRRQALELVSSHNDLNPGNLLYDGERIGVIDWEESAFQNDRFADLAVVGNFFLREKAEEEGFLQTYFEEKPDDYRRARFYLMQQICRMYHAMMVLTMVGLSGSGMEWTSADRKAASLREVHAALASGALSMGSVEGKVLWGQALLNEILVNAGGPRFPRSVKLMLG